MKVYALCAAGFAAMSSVCFGSDSLLSSVGNASTCPSPGQLWAMIQQYWIFLTIALAIAVFLLFHKNSETVEMPVPASFQKKAGEKKISERFAGELGDIPYSVEHLGDAQTDRGPVPLVTVSVPLPGPIRQKLIADKTTPGLPLELAEDINALFALGAVSVDIGFNADWIAVEIPADTVIVDRPLAERVVRHFAAIYEKVQ